MRMGRRLPAPSNGRPHVPDACTTQGAIPHCRGPARSEVHGSYPGPTIRANENDMLEITVVNKLFSEATTMHWHGIHPLEQPYMDGARDVTQAPTLGPTRPVVHVHVSLCCLPSGDALLRQSHGRNAGRAWHPRPSMVIERARTQSSSSLATTRTWLCS